MSETVVEPCGLSTSRACSGNRAVLSTCKMRLNTGMRGPDGLHVQVEDPNAGGGMMKAGIAAGTSAFPSRPAHS